MGGVGSGGGWQEHAAPSLDCTPRSEGCQCHEGTPAVNRRQPTKVRVVLWGKGGGGFVTPTEMNVHGDALCVMGKRRANHKTTETTPQGPGSYSLQS